MIDLTTIDQDTIIARGKYTTIRAAHEAEKKKLATLCSELSSAASQILRRMQPDNDELPLPASEWFDDARITLALMEASVKEIEDLAKMRAELKPIAWPR